MGNERNKRSRRAQSPLLKRAPSGSEAEASQGEETMIETFSNFENVSSVKNREAVLIDPTQNDNEMQVWRQRVNTTQMRKWQN